MTMNFASDNWAGVADEITQSLVRHASGAAPAYGASGLDRDLEQRFNDLFEREVAVFFVGTGTAANALALSAVNRPGGFVLCHRESHLIEDECGAPEFFTSGARTAPIDGALGKIEPDELRAALQRFDPGFVHHGQPMAVSITQGTEVGTCYSLAEILQIADHAHAAGVPLHMDGARFANAMVRLGCSPAEMTWRSGVDVLSFGGTKNGCWCAEALIFFKPEMAAQVPYIRKRAAQLFSKTRFIAAQFHAYLDNDLWLSLAARANNAADRLSAGITAFDAVWQPWSHQTNEVFVVMPDRVANSLKGNGATFYPWRVPKSYQGHIPPGHHLQRLVTSFATESSEVDEFLRRIV